MKNKPIIVILIILAVVKYFWFLPQSPFEADQEYLALKADEILNGKLTLLGAPTSIGGMFIGPLYSYFVAAVMFIFRGNPLVINGLSALWASLTIIALFIIGRRIFGSQAGIFAAIVGIAGSKFLDISTIPPLAIPMALAALIFIYITGLPKSSTRNFISGILVGLSLNLHFSGIFFLPVLIFFGSPALAGLLIPLLPLAAFELKHNFFIIKNSVTFLSSQSPPSQSIAIYQRFIVFLNSLAETIRVPSGLTAEILAKIITVIILILSFKLVKNKILLALLYLPMAFFLLYSGLLLPYYAAISWGPFLLILGAAVAFLWDKSRYFRPIIVTAFLIFFILQFKSWSHPSSAYGLDKKLQALQYIKLAAGDKPFHLSRTMYPTKDFGYPYLIKYLNINSSPVPINPTYTLVSPADWHQIKSDVVFGDIGIVLPKSEHSENSEVSDDQTSDNQTARQSDKY